jgi:hypothetical protein
VCVVSRVVNEAALHRVGIAGVQGNDGELLLNRCRVSVLLHEKFLEMDGSDIVQQCDCT